MSSGAISRAASRRGLLFILLAGALWGTSGVTSKAIYALADTNPASIAALRLALGAPVLLVVAWRAAGSRRFHTTRLDLTIMVLAGIFMGTAQFCYFSAIPRAGVAVATLVAICTAPVLVALLSTFVLREKPTVAVLSALVCAVIGVVLLVDVGAANGFAQANPVEGIAFALACGVASALLFLSSRHLAGRLHPLQPIAVAVSVGGALLLTLSSSTTGLVLDYPLPAWGLLLYLGVVPTALAYGMFFHGMRVATATVGSIGALAEPFTSSVLAVAIFGERLGTLGLIGATLLLGAMLFLLRNEGSGS